MKTKILTLILGGLVDSLGYGVGQSTHPMAINDRLSPEFTGILSDGRVWVFRLGILKS